MFIRNIPKSKFFLTVINPFLLMLLWLGLTFYYIAHLDTGLSVLSYNSSRNSFFNIPKGKLLKGESVSGVFQARDNGLGIVSVRFQTFLRPAYKDEDKLLFQIKEEGAKEWYYQSTYRDGIIYDIPFFPFGFPVIQNSKGKMYEFRITSLNGNNNNSVAISGRDQILSTKYQYHKFLLLHNKNLLFAFVVKKFINAMQTTDVFFSSLVYLFPLIFYLFLSSGLGRQIFAYFGKKFQQIGKVKLMKRLFPNIDSRDRLAVLIFDCILLGSVIIDIFILQLGNDTVYLLIPTLWIIIQKVFGFTSRKSSIVGIGLLFLPPVFSQLKLLQIAEIATTWAFLFLCAGLIQAMIEMKQNPEKVVIVNQKKRDKFLIIQSMYYS